MSLAPQAWHPGTIADTVEPLRELDPGRPDTDPLGVDPGLGEIFGASKELQVGDTGVFLQSEQRQRWGEVVEGLGLEDHENPMEFSEGAGLGNSLPTMLRHGLRTRVEQEKRIAELIRAGRAKDPGFLSGVPDDLAKLREWILEPMRQRRAEARATLGRDPGGVLSTVVQFGGAASIAIQNPATFATLPIGGFGGSLPTIFARETMVNSVLAAAIDTPDQAHSRKVLGEELTAGEVLTNIAIAGVAGGTLETALTAGGRVLSPVAQRALDKVNEARVALSIGTARPSAADVFAVLDNRELTVLSRELVGDEALTPDEKAAIAVLNREQEIGEASAFEAGPDGDTAHQTALATALQRLTEGRPRFEIADAATPDAPTRRPSAAGELGRDEIIRFTMIDLEGGAAVVRYSQADGGTTKYGIAAKFNPGVKVEALSEAQAADIYRRQYWFAGLDRAPPATAAVAFDAGVISGPKVGQRILAASGGDPERAIALYRAHLNHIADTVPGKAKYKRGWNNRVDKLAAKVGAAGDGRAAPMTGLAELGETRAVADAAEFEAELLARQADEPVEAGAAREPATYEPVPLLKRDLFGSDDNWIDAQLALGRSMDPRGDFAAEGAGNGPPARGEVLLAPTSRELWRLSQEELIAFRDEARLSDNAKLVKALGEEGAKRFKALERTANSSMDTKRADEASRLMDEEFGDLTPEQERLIYGIGEVEASVDEIDQLIRAHSDVMPGDDAGWSAYMGASAIRDASPADIAKVPLGQGTVRAQAAYIRMGLAMRNLADSGVPPAEAPARMAEALVERGGWQPEQASEIVQSFVEASHALRRELAPPDPANVRIDDPALKAFDDPDAAHRELADGLMHDLVADIDADPALADRAFDLGDGREPRSLRAILDEIGQEEHALSAVRACMAGGGG